jgi:hypothetical protein
LIGDGDGLGVIVVFVFITQALMRLYFIRYDGMPALSLSCYKLRTCGSLPSFKSSGSVHSLARSLVRSSARPLLQLNNCHSITRTPVSKQWSLFNRLSQNATPPRREFITGEGALKVSVH